MSEQHIQTGQFQPLPMFFVVVVAVVVVVVFLKYNEDIVTQIKDLSILSCLLLHLYLALHLSQWSYPIKKLQHSLVS